VKAKFLAFILCLTCLGLFGVKLKNIGIANSRVNKCYVVESQIMIFQIVGYSQNAWELSGRYKIEGVQFIIPFAQEVEQNKLDSGVDSGLIEEYNCSGDGEDD
jgi:hypothetical protein